MSKKTFEQAEISVNGIQQQAKKWKPTRFFEFPRLNRDVPQLIEFHCKWYIIEHNREKKWQAEYAKIYFFVMEELKDKTWNEDDGKMMGFYLQWK